MPPKAKANLPEHLVRSHSRLEQQLLDRLLERASATMNTACPCPPAAQCAVDEPSRRRAGIARALASSFAGPQVCRPQVGRSAGPPVRRSAGPQVRRSAGLLPSTITMRVSYLLCLSSFLSLSSPRSTNVAVHLREDARFRSRLSAANRIFPTIGVESHRNHKPMPISCLA
jgi:hypothetical protein